MLKKPTKKPKAGLVRESPAEYRTVQHLSATEAVRGFSELLNRVRYRGESFLIERGGVPVVELRPASPPPFTATDLLGLLESLPPVDEDFLDEVAAVANDQPALPESAWER